jgi:hypothetical protein
MWKDKMLTCFLEDDRAETDEENLTARNNVTATQTRVTIWSFPDYAMMRGGVKTETHESYISGSEGIVQ